MDRAYSWGREKCGWPGACGLPRSGGIWAKSHRQPHYVTDEDVKAAAAQIIDSGGADVLMTHGCPVGLADRTPRNTHGGQRCFLEAFQSIQPRLHLCGHLHVPQERALKDGRKVINVGATPQGTVVVVETRGGEMTASLERFGRAVRGGAPQ
jgi:Icc-related predicted phosphoesterase